MYILAVDTSGPALSVALLEDDIIRGEVFVNTGMNHSVQLLPAIGSIYEQTGIKFDATDLFVCALGPGSFTGLRIGVATIKGFAMASGKPVVGVSSLDVLAANVAPVSLKICPMMDAQRGQVYTAVYEAVKDAMPFRTKDETLTDLEPFLKEITEKTIFLGSGAVKHTHTIGKMLPELSFIAPERHGYNRAAMAGLLGIRKFIAGNPSDVLTLSPCYIRPSEAERQFNISEGSRNPS